MGDPSVVNRGQETTPNSRIVFRVVIAVLFVIWTTANAGTNSEVSFAGGIGGELRSARTSESNRGVSVFAALDQFVDPIFSLGMRVSYTGFNHTSYAEIGCRLAANIRSAEKFGPFFHSLIGVHSLSTKSYIGTIQSWTSIGYGVGLGLRIPLSKTGKQRFLIESTYYATRDARMFALRFGFAFGSLTLSESDEF